MKIDHRRVLRVYKSVYRPQRGQLLEYYQQMPSLSAAIESAAMAIGSDGHRFSHQRRLRRATLEEAKQSLLAAKKRIAGCSRFHELFTIVEERTGQVPGFGELAVYDTAVRIGGHLQLYPELVYLHAGARRGYLALGGDPKRNTVRREELPLALRELEPDELEDALCIFFKDGLGNDGKSLAGDSCYDGKHRRRKDS